MRIFYLANVRMPTEKAHGLQIMKTCEALAEKGEEVILCVPKRNNAISQDPFDYYGIKRNFKIRKVFSFDFLFLPSAKAAFILSQISFAIGALSLYFRNDDVIYARDEYSLYPLSFFKNNLYLEIHDDRNNFMMRRVLRSCDAVVSVSRGLLDLYASRGLPKNKQHLIRNGVDITKFGLQNGSEDVRAELGLSSSDKIVLYTGHLYNWKGVETLALASELLSSGVKVVFVGGTDHDIKAFKEKHAGKKNMMIVGHRSHTAMPGYLAAADVLILPNSGKYGVSELYTSPVKMFEYMAAKKPIVASDLPSMREVLDESNAILVPPDDVQALAFGITKALQDENLAQRIAHKARTDCEGYSWQKRAQQIIALVRQTGDAPQHAQETRKTEKFYDLVSDTYAQTRYEGDPDSFQKFFFQKRLGLVISFAKEASKGKSAPSLLDVGCADGYVISSLLREVHLGRVIGVDTSLKMIEIARAKAADSSVEYFIRGQEPKGSFDIVTEIGVPVKEYAGELRSAFERLAPGGYFIYSTPGSKSSLYSKLKDNKHIEAPFSFQDFEREALRLFEIVREEPYGLFVPKLWASKSFGRFAQPIFEGVFRWITPALFHEKIYLLRKKS